VFTNEPDRFAAVSGLGDDLVALLFEHLTQVHADDGLILGDHYAHRRGRPSVAIDRYGR